MPAFLKPKAMLVAFAGMLAIAPALAAWGVRPIMLEASPGPGSAEVAILEQARTNIPRLRQTAVTVVLAGPDGKTVADVPVRIEQTRHRFQFGSQIGRLLSPQFASAQSLVLELFNHFAFAGFIWDLHESQRGRPNHQEAERVLGWASQKGVGITGHSLVWTAHHPDWFWQISDPEERFRVAEARVRDVVPRFRGRVQIWDVVNEAQSSPLFTGPRGRMIFGQPIERVLRDVVDYMDRAFRWARESDPEAVLLINDTYLVSGRSLDRVEAILRELKRRNTPFDGIGVQAHMGFEGRVPMNQVWASLSRLSTHGRLHITEVTVPSQPPGPQDEAWKRRNWWEGWTEQTQADYLVSLYTVAFGHPAVDSVLYWIPVEHDRIWWRSTGLLREDLSPRPAYHALRRLIREEWWTRWEGRTDSAGSVRVQAFYGEHNLTVTLPDGRRLTIPFSVKQKDEVVRLTLQ